MNRKQQIDWLTKKLNAHSFWSQQWNEAIETGRADAGMISEFELEVRIEIIENTGWDIIDIYTAQGKLEAGQPII